MERFHSAYAVHREDACTRKENRRQQKTAHYMFSHGIAVSMLLTAVARVRTRVIQQPASVNTDAGIFGLD
jgi:hypothetical protein